MKEIVYFGTYTRRISQGIYKADFDTETGKHLKSRTICNRAKSNLPRL